MRTGTPGFNGARLREARQARSLTAVALADLTGVSSQAISQYERGLTTPSAEVHSRLAQSLSMPAQFFQMGDRSDDRGLIYFRSLASTTKAARLRAEHRFTWLRDVVGWLSSDITFPEPDLPDLGLSADPLQNAGSDLEVAAQHLRSAWNIGDGPIANVILLLENHGVVVARDHLGAESLDGLSEIAPDGRPLVMIGTDKGTAVRWRFDAAHELAHLLLHRSVAPHLLAKPEMHKHLEGQAHRFAAALLLPLAPFGDDLVGANLDSFRAIKPKWKTSIAMMIRRARDAGFVDEASERRLWINYSRRGWRRNEPLDDELGPEEPRMLRRAFEMVLEKGDRTSEDAVSSLGLPARDIENLCGLRDGFLGEYTLARPQGETNVLQFQPRSR